MWQRCVVVTLFEVSGRHVVQDSQTLTTLALECISSKDEANMYWDGFPILP